MTLPLILAANEEIATAQRDQAGGGGNRASVERWAKLYKVKTEGRSLAEIEKQLLLRADFVRCASAGAGGHQIGVGNVALRASGQCPFRAVGLAEGRRTETSAGVKRQCRGASYQSFRIGVRLHAASTRPRYAAFRARRHLLRGRSGADLGYQLSNFMDGYAEIGEVYVGKLKT